MALVWGHIDKTATAADRNVQTLAVFPSVLFFFFFIRFLLYVSVKYDYIGKLLKPGEEPTEYTDDEEGKNKKAD